MALFLLSAFLWLVSVGLIGKVLLDVVTRKFNETSVTLAYWSAGIALVNVVGSVIVVMNMPIFLI